MASSRRYILLMVLLMLLSISGFAQTGKDFWFVAPDVTSGHCGETDSKDSNLNALRITAGKNGANVTVSILGGAKSKTIFVPPNTQYSLKTKGYLTTDPEYWADFTVANLENSGLNAKNTKGIYVHSNDEDITVYYEVANAFNPDLFALKGENALGVDFIIPSQNGFANSSNFTPQSYEQINIVATENNTTIKIAPKSMGSLIGVAASVDTINVILNKGETYSVSSNNQSVGASLGGMYIHSDKKIAVTISDDSLQAGGQDLIGDQLIPTNVIGNDYVAIKCTTSGSGIVNKVYITATENKTFVTIDNRPVKELQRGEVWEVDFGSGLSSMYIHSDKSVYAYQVSGVNGEVGSAILPAITGCTGSESVTFTRNFVEVYWVQIMVQDKNRGHFTMVSNKGAKPLESDALNNKGATPNLVVWTKVNDYKIPATPAGDVWYTTTINMGLGGTSPLVLSDASFLEYYSISIDQGLFHLSVLDKNGGSMSYGYFSSYAAVAIEPVSQECEGSKILLTSKTSNASYGYQWSSKSGIALTPGNLPTQLVGVSDIYYLKRSNARCSATDSMNVVFDRPKFTLTQPGNVCPNEQIVIHAKPDVPGTVYKYTWSPVGSPFNDSIVFTLPPGGSRKVSVTAAIGKCVHDTTSSVVAYNGAEVDLTKIGAKLCVGDTIRNNGVLKDYLWTFPDNTTSTSPYIIAKGSGVYKLKGTSNDGCVATATTIITVNSLPVVKIDGQTLCSGVSATYSALAAAPTAAQPFTQKWVSNTSTNTAATYTISPSTIPAGLVWLKVTDVNGCSAIDTANVKWNSPSVVALNYTSASQTTSIDASTTIYTCAETPVTLTAAATGSAGVKSYKWSIAVGAGAPVVQASTTSTLVVAVAANEQKTVTVDITDNNNCTATDNVKIIGYATPLIDVLDDKICLGEKFTVKATTSVIAKYNWYLVNPLPNGTLQVTTPDTEFTPITADNYKVIGTSSDGCLSAPRSLVVDALPSVGITGNTVCANADYVFSGTPLSGVTYAWTQDGQPLTGTNQTFNVKLPGKVWLTVTNPATCSAKIDATPTWKTARTVDLKYTNSSGVVSSVSPALICPNSTVTITATVVPAVVAPITATYIWKVDNVVVAGAVASTYTLNPSPAAGVSKTVTVDATYDATCTTSKSVVITGYPDPAAYLTPKDICLYSSFKLDDCVDRSKINSFSWKNSGGIIQPADALNTFTPTVGGDYTLSIVDKNNCPASKIYKVIDATITIKNSSRVALCQGQFNLFEINNPLPTSTIYSWKRDAPAVSATGISYNATDSGTYKVEAIYKTALLECKDTTSVHLLWPSKKMVDVDATLSICNSGTPLATITGAGAPLFSNYTWTADGILKPVTTSTYIVPNTAPDNDVRIHPYKVTADYTFPNYLPIKTCPITQNFDLDVLATLNALDYDIKLKCEPTSATVCLCDGESIEFKTSTSVGYTSLNWTITDVSNNKTYKTGPKIIANTSGTYHLDAVQDNGCPAVGDVAVEVTPNPLVSISPVQVCENEDFTITNVLDAGYTYKWVYKNIDILNNSNTYTTKNVGNYKISAYSTGRNTRCNVVTSVDISYPPKPAISLVDSTICSSSKLYLDAQYIAPAGLQSSNWTYGLLPGSAVNPPNQVNVAGQYNLNITVLDLGVICPYTYPLYLGVVAVPSFTISDKEICKGFTATLATTGNYNTLLWNYYGKTLPLGGVVAPAKPYTPTQAFPSTVSIDVDSAGYYKVTGTVNGNQPNGSLLTCSSTSAPIHVTVNDNPIVKVTPDAAYLCENSFVALLASSPSVLAKDYSWTTGLNGNPSLTVNQGGYYGVTGIDAKGCVGTAGSTITPYVKTDVSLPVFQPICQGQTVTLPPLPLKPNVSGVVAFQWFFNDINNPVHGDLNKSWVVGTSGTYILNYLNEANGCWIQKSLDLTVFPLPVISVAAPAKSLCDGETFILDPGTPTAGSNYSYQWTRLASGLTPAKIVGADRTYEAKVGGSYRLIARENGCSSTSTTPVVVNPIPTVILGPDFSYCKDIPFTISVKNPAGLKDYVWSTGAADNGKASISATKDGIYTVTAKNGFDCSNDTSIVATSFAPTPIGVPAGGVVCSNGTVTLTSPLFVPSQILGYQWFYNSLTSGTQGANNSPWTVSAGGNYILQIRDKNGCFTQETEAVEVLQAPIVTLPAKGCYFDTLQVTPQASYVKYMWNGNASDNNYFKLVDPVSNKLYTVQVTDRNGCITNASVNYAASPLPNPVLGNDIFKCAGLFSTIQPSGGPFKSYLWSTGDNSQSLNVGSGDFWVKVTDVNGCHNTSATLKVEWLPLPQPYLGPDISICPLMQEILDAGVDSVGSVYPVYKWHTGSTSQTIVASIFPTINFVSVEDNKGCIGWDTKLVSHLPVPEFSVSGDTVLCDTYPLILDAGTQYSTFEWSTGTPSQVVSNDQTIDVSKKPGEYRITANDGCLVVSDTINVAFWPTPIVASLDTMIYASITVHAAQGTEPYLYTLNKGDLQEGNFFQLPGNGTYEVYVQDANGCWASDTVLINSVLDIEIPKVITPDGNGYNDKFRIAGLQERFPSAEVLIYDRYGKLIFKFRGSDEGWDGTYLGSPMPSDDYWCFINLVHINKTIKFNLTLKR